MKGLHRYATTKNLLSGEAFKIFEHKYHKTGSKTTENCELAIEGLAAHLLHSKLLQRQKRHLFRSLFKSWYSKI